MKTKSDKIVRHDIEDNIYEFLNNHFFESKDNVYIYDDNRLLGVIKYSSYLKCKYITDSIEEVHICESENDIDYDSFIIVNDNSIVAEYNETEENLFDIKPRFDDLYGDNDKINNYIKSLNCKKIYIFGSEAEKISNHIDMYGNGIEITLGKSIDDFYKAIVDNALIIDTDSEIVEFKRHLLESYCLSHNINKPNLLSLEELCENSEYYYFVNDLVKRNDINIEVLEFPDIYKLENLTDEQRSRIKFDHLYRYYYARYKDEPNIENLLKNVLGPLFSDEFILSRNNMPKVYLKGSRCFLEDNDNKYCSSFNGERTTTDQIKEYTYNFNFFGPCLVFGPLTDDSRTIPSYLQRLINSEDYDYQVHNRGARAIGLLENIRSFDGINQFKNDFNVFVVNQEEKEKLQKLGYNSFIDLKPVFEDKDLKEYFIDEPVHCNHNANSKIADYVFTKVKNKLKKTSCENVVEPVSVVKKKNVFMDNSYLKEYLSFLNNIEVTSQNNGCILMNCNPFTFGHYRLIEYASSQVETLYVFVVQENKSYFDFNERYEMVKEGCKGFNNVVVIPSGKIFASAMLFPQYFNKEDNQDVAIDVSLDRELFTQYIAPPLNIKKRFVGEENVDLVTRAYNKDIKKNLPLYGIEVIEIPRFREDGNEISAKNVRRALENDDWQSISKLVPESTVKILRKKKGK